MQHRRVQVVDGDLFLDRFEAALVGRAANQAGYTISAPNARLAPHGTPDV